MQVRESIKHKDQINPGYKRKYRSKKTFNYKKQKIDRKADVLNRE